jgi:UPF0755 protein
MEPEIKKNELFRSNPILNIFFAICFLAIFLYYTLSAPLSSVSIANREGVIIHIYSNEPLDTITKELEDKKVIRHAFVLKTLVVLFKFGHPIIKGDYLFKERLPVWRVAWMLARGEHGISPTKVTFKEGITNSEMANILADKLKAFRKDLFFSDPKSKQGYLFPDTYFFFPLTTSEEIMNELVQNFNKKTNSLKTDIDNSNHSFEDIIKMASIIQKEAKDESDASTIAGILWKRIKKGMPLQVDAVKSTYANIGFPDEPIGNPGLMAIRAALYPLDSSYLYYLHDKNGVVHYANTYDEHRKNINKYLK